MKPQQPPQPLFVFQEFAASLSKLSNRGYALHRRLVVLNENFLSYYRRVPKDFQTEGALGKANPKLSVRLDKVTSIELLGEIDHKKFRKLKSPDTKLLYVKIVFEKDALVKGQVTDRDLDSDEERDEDDQEEQVKNQRGELEWYF